MKLIPFSLEFYEDIVDMYYGFIVEVFGNNRKVSPKYFFYKEVQNWINQKKHIVIATNGVDVCGFSMCYIDEFNQLTEPVYNAEVCYVKPSYRNTRAAYLLYNNGYAKSKDLGLNIVTNGRVANGADKLTNKHFNLEQQFINFEGRK